jgi:hypothetical protein
MPKTTPGIVPFYVIPAPYQVRGELQPESSVFSALRTDWTPVFTGVTSEIQFRHTFRGWRGGGTI